MVARAGQLSDAKDFAIDVGMGACTDAIYQAIYADHPNALARQPPAPGVPTAPRGARRQPQRPAPAGHGVVSVGEVDTV